MKHYGLIGEKLGHSLSVPIHRIMFRELGLDADYTLIEVPKDGFEDSVRRLFEQYDGLNVTIPYKKDVIPLLDSLNPLAQEVGAVNTIRTGTPLQGFNTDVQGFSDMLRRAGISAAGKPCFILGTGGASLAVRTALSHMGASSITFVSRHPTGDQIGYEALPECFSGLLVNCTPAGMFPHPEGCPVPQDILETILPRASGVADLIYNPPETLLTKAAARIGIPWCTGLSMLVAQAVEAESIWQGYALPDSLTDIILKELVL